LLVWQKILKISWQHLLSLRRFNFFVTFEFLLKAESVDLEDDLINTDDETADTLDDVNAQETTDGSSEDEDPTTDGVNDSNDSSQVNSKICINY
jgi:hypothetical protein